MTTYATRSALDAAFMAGAPRHETERLYAADLEATSVAYAVAADAVGLRKDAARYLLAESIRLHQEAGRHIDRADELEDAFSLNGVGDDTNGIDPRYIAS